MNHNRFVQQCWPAPLSLLLTRCISSLSFLQVAFEHGAGDASPDAKTVETFALRIQIIFDFPRVSNSVSQFGVFWVVPVGSYNVRIQVPFRTFYCTVEPRVQTSKFLLLGGSCQVNCRLGTDLGLCCLFGFLLCGTSSFFFS